MKNIKNNKKAKNTSKSHFKQFIAKIMLILQNILGTELIFLILSITSFVDSHRWQPTDLLCHTNVSECCAKWISFSEVVG